MLSMKLMLFDISSFIDRVDFGILLKTSRICIFGSSYKNSFLVIKKLTVAVQVAQKVPITLNFLKRICVVMFVSVVSERTKSKLRVLEP